MQTECAALPPSAAAPPTATESAVIRRAASSPDTVAAVKSIDSGAEAFVRSRGQFSDTAACSSPAARLRVRAWRPSDLHALPSRRSCWCRGGGARTSIWAARRTRRCRVLRTGRYPRTLQGALVITCSSDGYGSVQLAAPAAAAAARLRAAHPSLTATSALAMALHRSDDILLHFTKAHAEDEHTHHKRKHLADVMQASTGAGVRCFCLPRLPPSPAVAIALPADQLGDCQPGRQAV